MNWLRIIHHTAYVYSEPVRFGRHRLVLRPREGHDLRIATMELSIRPHYALEWSRDIHGNSVALVDFLEPAKELVIENNVLVQRPPAEGLRLAGASQATWPVVYDSLETTMANAYRVPVYPDDQAAILRWLDSPAWPRQASVEATVAQLNQRINREFAYARREEKGVFTPGQTITEKRGSCRDLATLLLEACRALGLAARFASGYLEIPPAEHGAMSTHAWTEVYLPGYGWRGYDPTSGRLSTSTHVVTGVSHHPRGVMPVSGNYYGERSVFRALNVSVRMEWPSEYEATAVPVSAF